RTTEIDRNTATNNRNSKNTNRSPGTRLNPNNTNSNSHTLEYPLGRGLNRSCRDYRRGKRFSLGSPPSFPIPFYGETILAKIVPIRKEVWGRAANLTR